MRYPLSHINLNLQSEYKQILKDVSTVGLYDGLQIVRIVGEINADI